MLDAVRAQEAERSRLVNATTAIHTEALNRVTQATEDGSLLRGEVLARWQELVGTGEFLRGLESQVSRLRDRVTAAVLGRPAPAERVEEAIESSLTTLLVNEAQRARLETEQTWRRAGTVATRCPAPSPRCLRHLNGRSGPSSWYAPGRVTC
ncbi:hypothetical protein [Actinomyces ruminis]|uniref:hypothetical protein n=1 Tax=Actinomyces ruminis TaxID=1937003 RepID=UPI0030B86487